MNALLRKEIRLLLPVWIAAVVQAVLPTLFFWGAFHQPPPEVLLYVPFSLGVLLLGLSSFGYEFGTGTFSILLAQPIPRIQIWRLKTRLLALALASVWLSLGCAFVFLPTFSANNGSALDLMVILALMTVVAFSSVLWTTLLFRQVAAAFWFSILIPSFITVFSEATLRKESEYLVGDGIIAILLLYSLAGFLWARWMFLRAQDTAWTGGEISLPGWLSFRTQTPAQLVVPKLKPLRALVRKEFQSHHITLLMGAALLVSHLVGIVVRKLEFDPTNLHKAIFEVFGFWWLLWFALPMIIGGTVVAEERKLGTLEGQLCLPVKRGWHFAVKFVVALLLGVFLGGVMPAVCEGIGLWAGVSGEFPVAQAPGFGIWLLACCLIATGITLVSVYASTFTRNLLQALGTAVLAGMVLAAFGVLVVQQEHFAAPLWMGPLGIYIGLPVMVVTLMWLAFKNFKSLNVGLKLWLRNGFTVLAAMVLVVSVTALVWNRVWELGMTLEPAHGPARLTGEQRPSIGLTWGAKIFALLPDGRIWVANKSRMQETGDFESYRDKEGKEQLRKVQIQIPLAGTFLTSSNWTQLAGSHPEVVGLAADGSLWNLFRADQTNIVELTNYLANFSRTPRQERMGTDSDWKTVVNSRNGFIALKQNGSLWTWKRRSQAPEQFGHDFDWTAIFASRQSFTGIKRDGSVWKWGYLHNSPSGYDRDWKQEHPEPVQWYPAGGDWLAVDANDNFDLLIKRDGTLWASGHLPENILGEPVRVNGPSSRFSAQPVQIGTNADFADIKANWSSMVVLKKTGTIYHNNFNSYERALFVWGRIWKLSQHSDWVVIQRQDWTPADLALAGDGTLSAWGDPLHGSNQQLLGPSRKPLWTLNIFAEAK